MLICVYLVLIEYSLVGVKRHDLTWATSQIWLSSTSWRPYVTAVFRMVPAWWIVSNYLFIKCPRIWLELLIWVLMLLGLTTDTSLAGWASLLHSEWVGSLEPSINKHSLSRSWNPMDVDPFRRSLLSMSWCQLSRFLKHTHFFYVVANFVNPVLIISFAPHPSSDFHLSCRLGTSCLQTVGSSMLLRLCIWARWIENFFFWVLGPWQLIEIKFVLASP